MLNGAARSEPELEGGESEPYQPKQFSARRSENGADKDAAECAEGSLADGTPERGATQEYPSRDRREHRTEHRSKEGPG